MSLDKLRALDEAASGEHDDSSCYCYNEGWGKNRCRVGPAEKSLAALDRHLLLPALEALEKIGHDENTSYLACPGPPNCDHSHYPTCPVQIARAVLAQLEEALK